MSILEIGTYVGGAAALTVTAWQSYRANKQTKNTGNGWAGHVVGSLAEIKDGIARVEGKIDRHIEDHAEADLRRGR